MARTTIYLIPTPIGDHFVDFAVASLRRLETLRHLFVEADDGFLQRARAHKVVTDRHQVHFLAAPSAVEEAVALVRAGESFGILASSGIPGFVDPGHRIVDRLFRDHIDDVTFVPLGLSSALDAALTLSGTDLQTFVFAGHVPEHYRFEPALFALEMPVIFFVRGPGLDELWGRLQASKRSFARVVVHKDVRKKTRAQLHVWAELPQAHGLETSSDADYVVCLISRLG